MPSNRINSLHGNGIDSKSHRDDPPPRGAGDAAGCSRRGSSTDTPWFSTVRARSCRGQSRPTRPTTSSSACAGSSSRRACRRVPGPPPRSSYPQYYFYCAYWDKNGVLEPDTWMNDVGEKIPNWLESARLYYAYTGDASVMRIVKDLVDYTIEHGTTPATVAWPYFPYTADQCGRHGIPRLHLGRAAGSA